MNFLVYVFALENFNGYMVFYYCLSILSYYAADEGSLELLKRLAKKQLSMTSVRPSEPSRGI